MDNFSILVIILIVIVVLIIVMCMCRSNGNGNNKHLVEQQSPVRHPSQGAPRYTTVFGQVQAARPADPKPTPPVAQPNQNQDVLEFPRNSAQASRPVTESENTQDSIKVKSMADLFSPKIDYMAEYGMSEDEMLVLAAQRKKDSEYQERNLPISTHFDMNKYKTVTETIQMSGSVKASAGKMKGRIVQDMFSKHADSFTNKRTKPVRGETLAVVASDAQKDAANEKFKRPAMKSTLVDLR